MDAAGDIGLKVLKTLSGSDPEATGWSKFGKQLNDMNGGGGAGIQDRKQRHNRAQWERQKRRADSLEHVVDSLTQK